MESGGVEKNCMTEEKGIYVLNDRGMLVQRGRMTRGRKANGGLNEASVCVCKCVCVCVPSAFSLLR